MRHSKAERREDVIKLHRDISNLRTIAIATALAIAKLRVIAVLIYRETYIKIITP